MSGSLKSNVSSTSESSISESTSSTLKTFTTLELDEFTTFMADSSLAMYKITRNSQDVFINLDKLKCWSSEMITNLIEKTTDSLLGPTSIQSERHNLIYNFALKDENKLIDLMFVLNSLNFNLWNSQNEKQWIVREETGYIALHSALERALEERRPIWNPSYYSKLKQVEVEIIFQGDDEDTNIPLIKERVRTLREIGKILIDKYEGSFLNCIKICNGDAFKLHHLLYNEFESYRDTVNYEGKTVYIGCKAATLINDLWHLNRVSGVTSWIPTILADYRAPQVLVSFEILAYSDRLKARLTESDEPFEHGSIEDMEIRCCSLIACKRLTQLILNTYKQRVKDGMPITLHRILDPADFEEELNVCISTFVDDCIWFCRHSFSNLDDVPMHNVRSLYY